jgi:DNA polymerase
MLRELELAEVVGLSGVRVGAVGEREVPAAEAVVPSEAASGSRPALDASTLTWDALREAVRACTACSLCRGRKQAVFGVGSQAGPWMFIGEGPGADEDEQGDPFVGQAGKLLDSMLAAIGLSRDRDSYIANVVKCRPPGNRTPTLDEAKACAAYLDRQIDLVNPKLLVALGKTAASRLLDTEASLASLRGRVHTYRGRPLVVTYHPAYLLRTLPDKAKAWDDLLLARRTFLAAASKTGT